MSIDNKTLINILVTIWGEIKTVTVNITIDDSEN